jgi:hypothetical protein
MTEEQQKIAYDVGKHAAHEALMTMMRICSTAGPARNAALPIATAFIRHKIEGMAKIDADSPAGKALNALHEHAYQIFKASEADILEEIANKPLSEVVEMAKRLGVTDEQIEQIMGALS